MNIRLLELQTELKEKKRNREKSEDGLIKVIVGFLFCAVCSLILFCFKIKAE
jgi:zinc transporter ZupT